MKTNSNRRIVDVRKTSKIDYTSKEFRRNLEKLNSLRKELIEYSKPDKERMYESFN